MTLVVRADSADPADSTYFTWVFPNDGFWGDTSFSNKKDTLYGVTIPNVSHYNTVIKIVANRKDCQETNIGDTLYYKVIIMDTISPKGEIRDARYFTEALDLNPCEGDTVRYVLSEKQDTTIYNFEWSWNNGKDTTLHAATDSIDASGWQILYGSQFNDTLILVVGADSLNLGVRVRSYCGASAIRTIKIDPTQHLRQKPYISFFDTIFCHNEERTFRVDSVPYATDFVWYFPFGKQIDTTHDALYNASQREYTFKEEKYDTGLVYVLAYNRCETGLYSDTIRIIDTLSPPSNISLPGYDIVNDSVFDTVCLRLDKDYFAHLDDTFYGVRYKWSLLEGIATLSEHEAPLDSVCGYKNENYNDITVVAVTARHKFCQTYGDSLFIVASFKDTAVFPDGKSLDDYMFVQGSANSVSKNSSPCAGSIVNYYLNMESFGQDIDSAFFMWNGGNYYNKVDSAMAMPSTTGATFKLIDSLHVRSDSLTMKVGKEDSIFLFIQTHNSCGYSLLGNIKIVAGEALTDPSHKLISDDTAYLCQKDTVIITHPVLKETNTYVWYYPWAPYCDTAGNQRVFSGIDFDYGEIYAQPFNGCGPGEASSKITIAEDSIFSPPQRVVPDNFALGQSGIHVWDTVCMRSPLSLVVSRNTADRSSDSLVFKWTVVNGNSANTTMTDSICSFRQDNIRDVAYTFYVAARQAKCSTFGDTLTVSVLPMDTVAFAVAVNDTFFEIILDSTLIFEDVSGIFPEKQIVCGTDTVLYRMASLSKYHWSVDSVWLIYPDTASTKWEYIVAGSDSLRAVTNNDSFAFSIAVRNACGISHSRQIIIRPNHIVTDTPVIVPPEVFCFNDGVPVEFKLKDSIDNAEDYVWTFPWNDNSVVDSIKNYQSSDSLRLGSVMVYARNECGNGPVSDTFNITNIRYKPQRPNPIWYDRLSMSVSGDTVIDSICLNTAGMLLNVEGEQGDTTLHYMWDVTIPYVMLINDGNEFDSAVTATSISGGIGEITVTSRWADCNAFGDTLTIQLVVVDTATAADIIIDVTPEDTNYCPGAKYTLSITNSEISPAYKWTLPEGWQYDTATAQDTFSHTIVVVTGETGGRISVAAITDTACRICSYTSGAQQTDSFTRSEALANNGFKTANEDTNDIMPCAGDTIVRLPTIGNSLPIGK